MDRMLLESFPYRVIEGLAIAACAVGASRGYFYIRHEYPLAFQRIGRALEECRRAGLIGAPNHERPFALDIRVVQGAGAFVCGEETALLASIESQRPFPRLRPPYPAQAGLWGHPTLVNNVETMAMIPWIVRHSPEAFRRYGTADAPGAKVFCLVGKVNQPSLIEVPMGTPIREVVFGIGQGIPNNKAFKAVQIGGPSGACLPAALDATPLDYHSLQELDAIMGSGGIVVLDEDDCMVELALYFLAFTRDQSCGKCSFCRVGTYQMHSILERICRGQGRDGDLDRLEQLAHWVHQGSLCGLGKTAANPVLSTLKYFRDEYEAHLAGKCPAKKCPALIHYRINDKCIGCTRCAQHCPVDAIAFTPYQKACIDDARCVRCGTCKKVCPSQAVEVE